MKQCSMCKEWKEETEFSKNKSLKDGLECQCRPCRSKYKKLSRENYTQEEINRVKKHLHDNYITKLEERKKQARNYYQNHTEERKESMKKYEQSDNGKLICRLIKGRRRARQPSVINDLTIEDIQNLFEMQDGKCPCCGKEFSNNNRYEIDHIIPVSKGGGLTFLNVQLLCKKCNMEKFTKDTNYLAQYLSEKVSAQNLESFI